MDEEVVTDMKAHGGDIYSPYAIEKGKSLVDFSANLNPLGMPERAKAAIAAHLNDYEVYPDTEYRSLRAAIGRWEGVDPGEVCVGCGAADLIFRLAWALRPQRGLVAAPTFSEYAAALRSVGCAVEEAPLRRERGFALDTDFVGAVRPGTEIVFVCSPNNPTGVLTERDTLVKLADRCREVGAVLVVDECFLDFAPDAADYTMKPILHEYENLVILRAFTKLFAMAGLRLGYLLSAGPVPERVRGTGQPWSVSTVAAVCGEAALQEPGWREKSAAYVAEERAFLFNGLREAGLEVLPGAANYLLFRSECTALYEALLPCGILLRRCANFTGLDAHWYRAAVRTREENGRLLAALNEVKARGVKL